MKNKATVPAVPVEASEKEQPLTKNEQAPFDMLAIVVREMEPTCPDSFISGYLYSSMSRSMAYEDLGLSLIKKRNSLVLNVALAARK